MDRPPTPYFELKPANRSQQQVPLADVRSCGTVIAHLSKLSFDQLLSKLQETKLIENGYTERDLALACLVNFYHFDLARALGKSFKPQQRLLLWKNETMNEAIPLVIYPGLTQLQFETILQLAKTEQWPLTPRGLFLLLQKQKGEQNIDPSLIEAFMTTSEFLAVELLFKRGEVPLSKQELVEVILEGNWFLLSQFVEQQRQLNDLSQAKREKFLLDYIAKGSQAAAYLLLKTELEFASKKLDNAQVVTILQLLPRKTPESERFALSLLMSPRSTSVWQQASLKLYEYAGEPIPKDWNYQTSLKRFVSKDIPILQKEVNHSSSKPMIAAETRSHVATIRPVQDRLASTQYRLYIVQEGDSLWKISRRFGVDMEILKKKNQLKSNAIKPGTVLKIP